MKDDSKKTKVYGARGEIELEDIFKKYIGKGVNEAIRTMINDVRELNPEDHIFDIDVFIKRIEIKRLTEEREFISAEIEAKQKERKLIDERIKELEKYNEVISEEISKYTAILSENIREKQEIKESIFKRVFNEVLFDFYEDGDFNAIKLSEIIESRNENNFPVNEIIDYIDKTYRAYMGKKVKLQRIYHSDNYGVSEKIFTDYEYNNLVALLEECRV